MKFQEYRKNGFARTLSLALAGVLLITSTAWAQVLEEIVVTAQKRSEDLQDTPVAVTAFTGEQLQQAGVYDSIALSNVVPNVTVGTENARDAIFINIRGISQSERRNTSDPTTAFYVDGALVPRMSGINAYFYDLERVEVLRGPQGTLYGRNSTSGVVNVITKKPDLKAFGGDIQFGYGNYDAVDVKGALNVPFSDSFGARVAVNYTERDGFRDNGPLVADGDDADDLGVRGHLLWDIGENTSLLLSADYYERQGVGPVNAQVECADLGCSLPTAPKPADTNPLNTEGFRDNTDTNFKIELNHALSFADLTFIGSYRDHERDYLIDLDGSGASVFLPPAGRMVAVDTVVREVTESESFSGELRLNSNTDGRVRWILGGFYLDEDIKGDFRFQPVLPNGLHLNVQFVDKGFNVESWAAFANASVDVTDRFTLNGGIRYTEDEKDKGGVNDPANPTAGSYQLVSIRELDRPVRPFFPSAQVANPSWSEVTYSFGLDWHINDDTLAYVKNSKGFKSGGFNRGSNLTPFDDTPNVFDLVVYNPEQVLASEAGIKSTLMDGRARANFSVFWYDYSDKEEAVVRVIGGIPVNTAINAGQATIYGAELETTLLYGDYGGRIDLNVGWLDAEFDEFFGLDDPLTPILDDLDLSGGDMVNAPDWNISATWMPVEWEVLNGMLRPMVQFSFKSDYITRPHDQSVDKQDSYTRTNASLHWESNKTGLFLEGFVHNIEDEDIQTTSECQQRVNGVAGTGLPGFGL